LFKKSNGKSLDIHVTMVYFFNEILIKRCVSIMAISTISCYQIKERSMAECTDATQEAKQMRKGCEREYEFESITLGYKRGLGVEMTPHERQWIKSLNA